MKVAHQLIFMCSGFDLIAGSLCTYTHLDIEQIGCGFVNIAERQKMKPKELSSICVRCKKELNKLGSPNLCDDCWQQLWYGDDGAEFKRYKLSDDILAVLIYVTSGILVGLGMSLIYHALT